MEELYNKIIEKSEIAKLSEEVRTIRELLKYTQDRMVKEISAICLMNGGKIDTSDLSVESDDMPCVSYDGSGDNLYSDPYSKVNTIKAKKHKTREGVEYDGFVISVSAETCDAVLDDYELSYSEIENIFLFLTQDENIEILLEN